MAKTADSKYKFYTSAEYWAELPKRIDQTKPGDRVMLMTMDFEPSEPAIGRVVEALLQAAKRGVNVWLIVDAHSFLFDSVSQRLGPLWFGRPLSHVSKIFAPRLRALQEIDTQVSGHSVIINRPDRPFSNPFAGRSHIKFSLVGDELFLGGCNLYGTGQLDIMMQTANKTLVEYMFDFGIKVFQDQHAGESLLWQDKQLAVNESTQLFIDAGKPKQSAILSEAYKLIDEAKERIFMTCQYFPGNETAKHLKAAYDRGVKVEIFYSHPSEHGRSAPIHHIYAFKERLRLPQTFFANRLLKGLPKLHAKVLCTENGAMLGSHNFVNQGVVFGTAEISFHRLDREFSQKLEDFMKKQIRAAVRP